MTEHAESRLSDAFPVTARARDRLARMAIFSETDYLKLNPDVAQADLDGLSHAWEHGQREGRELFTDAAVARTYGEAARSPALSPTDDPVSDLSSFDRSRPVSVFVHSLSELAARDAAEALAQDLRQAGLPVSILDEGADYCADHGAMIFVSPHDFFHLGRGCLWWDPAILMESFVYNTVSVETVEGRRAMAAILNARGVFEPSTIWAHLWRQAAIPTLQVAGRILMRDQWLEPADHLHPLILAAPVAARSGAMGGRPWSARPLDLLHFDRDTERRNAFFGRHASSLARHSTFLYLQQGAPGMVQERMYRRAHDRIYGHLTQQSRLTLSLADDRFPTFDRYKVIHQAMAGGSAVVSDVSFFGSTLQEGVHYFHDDAKHIAALIDWLLEDADGQRAAEQAVEAGYDLVSSLNGDTARPRRIAAFLTGSDAAERRT